MSIIVNNSINQTVVLNIFLSLMFYSSLLFLFIPDVKAIIYVAVYGSIKTFFLFPSLRRIVQSPIFFSYQWFFKIVSYTMMQCINCIEIYTNVGYKRYFENNKWKSSHRMRTLRFINYIMHKQLKSQFKISTLLDFDMFNNKTIRIIFI
jgi:hypothetical protein